MTLTMDTLRDLFIAGKVKIDFRGHNGLGVVETPPFASFKDFHEGTRWGSPFPHVGKVHSAIYNHDLLGRYHDTENYDPSKSLLEPFKDGDYHALCSNCGEHLWYDIKCEGEGEGVHIVVKSHRAPSGKDFWDNYPTPTNFTETCSHPKGFPEYGPVIHFPTGSCVAGDSLFIWGEHGTEQGIPTSERSCNGPLWAKEITYKYGDLGIASAFCGNTCPDIYRSKSGNALAIVGGYAPGGSYTKIGGVCTDLWWWSIADVQVWEEVGKRLGVELSAPWSEFQIKPGYWQVVSRHHLIGEERNPVYGRLRYLGETWNG